MADHNFQLYSARKRANSTEGSQSRKKPRLSDEESRSDLVMRQTEIVQEWKANVQNLEAKLAHAKDQLAKEGGKLADLITNEHTPNFPTTHDEDSNMRSPSLSHSPISNRNDVNNPNLKQRIAFNSTGSANSTTRSKNNPSPGNRNSIQPTHSTPSGDQHEFIRSSETFDRLNINLASTFHAAHDYKPRAIVFNPRKSNYFCTSGLDGAVRFWEYTNQKTVADLGSLNAPDLRTTRFATALSWHKDGTRCASLFPTKTSAAATDEKLKARESQLVILNTIKLPNVSATFLTEKPHKDPSDVAFLTANTLVTVGTDKLVVLWKVDYQTNSAATKVLHTAHTSAITTLLVNSDGNILYTAGVDKKCIRYSLESEKVVNELRFGGKIASIRANPVHDHLLLVTLCTTQDQFHIYDTRAEEEVLTLSYNFDNPDQSPSQYIIPSWSADGTLVASGSVDPRLSVWDVRYAKAHLPIQQWSVHKKRVLRAEFHPSVRNCLFTLASDRKLGCHHMADRKSVV